MAETATKPDPKMVKHTYVLQCASWIGPHLKQKDEKVEMTEAEARYYVPHVLKKKSDMRNATKPADPAPASKSAKDKS